MDPERFPRVVFLNDTQWEAYKEDVQSEIRRETNNDGLASSCWPMIGCPASFSWRQKLGEGANQPIRLWT